MKSGWVLLVFPIVVGSLRADQPDIIYVLADDLGYGDLACYGGEKIQTPQIDAMAAEGARKGKWKAFRGGLQKNREVPVELDDLEKNIAETIDVAGDYPEVAERLLKLMEGVPTAPDIEDVLYTAKPKKKAKR